MIHLWHVRCNTNDTLLVRTSGDNPEVAADVGETVFREQGVRGPLTLRVSRLVPPEGDTGLIYEPSQRPYRFFSKEKGHVERKDYGDQKKEAGAG